jgi:hypothetical protein
MHRGMLFFVCAARTASGRCGVQHDTAVLVVLLRRRIGRHRTALLLRVWPTHARSSATRALPHDAHRKLRGVHVQVEAMKAVANSHSKRSLQQFEEALVKYTPQVRATCNMQHTAV